MLRFQAVLLGAMVVAMGVNLDLGVDDCSTGHLSTRVWCSGQRGDCVCTAYTSSGHIKFDWSYSQGRYMKNVISCLTIDLGRGVSLSLVKADDSDTDHKGLRCKFTFTNGQGSTVVKELPLDKHHSLDMDFVRRMSRCATIAGDHQIDEAKFSVQFSESSAACEFIFGEKTLFSLLFSSTAIPRTVEQAKQMMTCAIMDTLSKGTLIGRVSFENGYRLDTCEVKVPSRLVSGNPQSMSWPWDSLPNLAGIRAALDKSWCSRGTIQWGRKIVFELIKTAPPSMISRFTSTFSKKPAVVTEDTCKITDRESKKSISVKIGQVPLTVAEMTAALDR